MSRYYPPVTVTGNHVNFSAPNGGKLDSVSVQIIPTQDLHGYANPWPAGGGKNLFDCDTTVQAYINASGYETVSPHNAACDYILLKPNTDYCVSCNQTMRNIGTCIFNDTKTSVLSRDDHNNVQSVVISSSANTRYLRAWINVDNSTTMTVAECKKYEPQVEAGNMRTSFAPYANICPISGLTGLSVYVSPTQDPDDATVYNVDWSAQAGTVYGGTVDVVSGELTVDMVNIPSYNGETINEPWLSSMDAYTPGATPTTGAQVVYELATPLTYQLTPKQIAALIDQNYIWSSNNETISVVYALLVPGSDKYTLIVNGVDIADFVERDSYRTTLYPVFSEAVQTLDGVGHTALLRKKGELSARFNPRTAADTAIICAALLNAPCEVQYHCLQRNADVTALMTIDSVSALYLSRCLYCRQKWNDIDSITLTEL